MVADSHRRHLNREKSTRDCTGARRGGGRCLHVPHDPQRGTRDPRTGGNSVAPVGRHEKLNPRFQPSAHSLSVLRSNQRASLTSRSVALLSSMRAHASWTTSAGIINPVSAQNRTLSRATAQSPNSRNRGKRGENAIADWSPEAEVVGSNPSASAKEFKRLGDSSFSIPVPCPKSVPQKRSPKRS